MNIFLPFTSGISSLASSFDPNYKIYLGGFSDDKENMRNDWNKLRGDFHKVLKEKKYDKKARCKGN